MWDYPTKITLPLVALPCNMRHLDRVATQSFAPATEILDWIEAEGRAPGRPDIDELRLPGVRRLMLDGDLARARFTVRFALPVERDGARAARARLKRLVARGTVEEKIVELHRHKRDLDDSLLEGTEAAARLSGEDLLRLLQA